MTLASLATYVNNVNVWLAGHKCTSDAVEDVQLKHLLEERQAAYVALVMAAYRWQVVWQLYEKVHDLCKHRVAHRMLINIDAAGSSSVNM